jgi:hypothetical protein
MSSVNVIPRFTWALKPSEPWQTAASWIGRPQGFALAVSSVDQQPVSPSGGLLHSAEPSRPDPTLDGAH